MILGNTASDGRVRDIDEKNAHDLFLPMADYGHYSLGSPEPDAAGSFEVSFPAGGSATRTTADASAPISADFMLLSRSKPPWAIAP